MDYVKPAWDKAQRLGRYLQGLGTFRKMGDIYSDWACPRSTLLRIAGVQIEFGTWYLKNTMKGFQPLSHNFHLT